MEYLWSLRMVSRHMDKMGRHGMLFLAAAVSDFHVPRDKLRRHKIDSSRDTARGGTALTLHLDQVNEEGGTERGWRAGGERRQSANTLLAYCTSLGDLLAKRGAPTQPRRGVTLPRSRP